MRHPLRHPVRRRVAGLLGSVVFPLFVLQGCAHVVLLRPDEYPDAPNRKGTAFIHTRDGRVYELNRVAVDSSRFVGRVDVMRSVVTRDGHLDAVEATDEVKIPFTDVTRVEMRSSNVLGTVVAVGVGVGLVVMLAKALGGVNTDSGGITVPPDTPPTRPQPPSGRGR